MITVATIDRLVQRDDAVAARLWPRLGPKVQGAYLDDRTAWISVRRSVAGGETPPAAVLAKHQQTFAGWARAFHAASRSPKRSKVTHTPAGGPPISAPRPHAPEQAKAIVAPALSTASRSMGGAGAAVAGGLVLAGLVAIAARRRHP